MVSGADFWCNLHYCSSRGPSQGSRGPKGPKIGKKIGAGFIILSSLRSAQGKYWSQPASPPREPALWLGLRPASVDVPPQQPRTKSRVKVGTLWGSAQLYWDGGPIMLWFVIVFKVVLNFVDLGGPGHGRPAGRGTDLTFPHLDSSRRGCYYRTHWGCTQHWGY